MIIASCSGKRLAAINGVASLQARLLVDDDDDDEGALKMTDMKMQDMFQVSE